MIDPGILAQMLAATLAAIVLYTFIGFIPGTDETSVLVPVSLALVLAQVEPIVILTFFIAAIVTLNLTNAIPTALVGLPGGVMSAPMMEHSLLLRERGLAAQTIKKMAAGSVIGTLVSIPVSLALASALIPFADTLRQYSSLLFVAGAVLLSLLGRNRILSLVAIVPLAFLFQGLLALYRQQGVLPENGSISVSFFLAITVGPMLVSLLSLLNPGLRTAMPHGDRSIVKVSSRAFAHQTLNPAGLLTRAESAGAGIASLVSSLLFFLSPVGLTFLLGEAASGRSKDPVVRSDRAITAMSGVAHATYLSGVIIPLVAVGIPLSPVAVGPANALFNAPPVFTLDHNLHHVLSTGQMIAAIVLGAIVALALTYVIAVRFSHRITLFVMRRIPHEAVLGLFIGFILLLAYLDAGPMNVFGVLLVGIVCGTFNRLGVGYGVQFMVLYASPWIVQNLL